MKISQAQVEMVASHQRRESRALQESLQLFQVGGEGESRRVSVDQGTRISLSARAVELAQQVERQDPGLHRQFRNDGPARPAAPPHALPARSPFGPVTAQRSAPTEPAGDAAELTLDANTLLLKRIVEQLSGRAITLLDPARLTADDAAEAVTPAATDPAPPPQATEPPRDGEWGMRYTRTTAYSETEDTHFSATALVTTADGRQLKLNLELQMSRRFASQSQLEISAGAQLKDPLVINLGLGATRLADDRVAFDLDADGRTERIAFVDSNSGLLALDRNGDGRINDGSELFGALSGNGFTDLARYDEDGNGFIDAGDTIFGELKIWLREDGNDRLLALADQGIGALYLGYTDTPFALKDESNRLEGMIRASGVYLNEDGSGGTLQQIDLVT